MTREEAARFPYGSAGAVDAVTHHVTAEEPRPAAATAENKALHALVEQQASQLWYLRRELDSAMDKLSNPANPYRGAL